MLIDVMKWEKIIDLINCKETKTIMFISKELDITYTHVMKIIKEMKDIGIVKVKKKGRTRCIKLTPKGLNIADHISHIVKFVNKNAER